MTDNRPDTKFLGPAQHYYLEYGEKTHNFLEYGDKKLSIVICFFCKCSSVLMLNGHNSTNQFTGFSVDFY